MSLGGRGGSFLAVFGLQALLLLVFLNGCAANSPLPPAATQESNASSQESGENLMAVAAAQATAIIQQAQATAMVLQAQSQATALVAKAEMGQTPAEVPNKTQDPQAASSTPENGEAGSPTPERIPVEIIRVGYAADQGFIIVSYRAEPDVAETFWPGQLSVTDEADGTVYNEVPVMPKIGPMISRPVVPGQVGYIMFSNPPPGLKPGSLVTVVLVNYVFEHLVVE